MQVRFAAGAKDVMQISARVEFVVRIVRRYSVVMLPKLCPVPKFVNRISQVILLRPVRGKTKGGD